MKRNELKKLIKEIISVILEGPLRGEWWFQDGQAIYADGDVGDVNHEGYVIDILKRQLLDTLGVDVSDYEHVPNFYEISDEIYQEINGELTDDEKEEWTQGTNADIEKVIMDYLQRKGDAETKEILNYLTSASKDAREYALIHWGWQRVKMNVIQTQTLTEKDVKNISNGLYGAYSDELDETDEERITDTNPRGEHTFNIEVMATRSYYTDIPWSVLAKDDPTALNGYRTRYEQ